MNLKLHELEVPAAAGQSPKGSSSVLFIHEKNVAEVRMLDNKTTSSEPMKTCKKCKRDHPLSISVADQTLSYTSKATLNAREAHQITEPTRRRFKCRQEVAHKGVADSFVAWITVKPSSRAFFRSSDTRAAATPSPCESRIKADFAVPLDQRHMGGKVRTRRGPRKQVFLIHRESSQPFGVHPPGRGAHANAPPYSAFAALEFKAHKAGMAGTSPATTKTRAFPAAELAFGAWPGLL